MLHTVIRSSELFLWAPIPGRCDHGFCFCGPHRPLFFRVRAAPLTPAQIPGDPVGLLGHICLCRCAHHLCRAPGLQPPCLLPWRSQQLEGSKMPFPETLGWEAPRGHRTQCLLCVGIQTELSWGMDNHPDRGLFPPPNWPLVPQRAALARTRLSRTSFLKFGN